ncbi:MAG: hypothetical protein ACK5NT_08935 [Pyrinomonadaceae bacterium]
MRYKCALGFFMVYFSLCGSVFAQDQDNVTNRIKAQDILKRARLAASNEYRADEIKTIRVTQEFSTQLTASVSGRPDVENKSKIKSQLDFDLSGFKVKESLEKDTVSTFRGISQSNKTLEERVLNGNRVSYSSDMINGGPKQMKFDLPNTSSEEKANIVFRTRIFPTLFPITYDLSILPFDFYYVGIAESENKRANVIEAAMKDGQTLKLFFDQDNDLLLLITFMSATDEGTVKEDKYFYSEYKDINGLLVATKIKRNQLLKNKAITEKNVELREVKELQINPTFKVDNFKEN